MHLMNAPTAQHRAFKHGQRGISLIESMIALVVLALGIMGLAGVQSRLLVESRTANYRAIAIGLIDDLNNRMLLNRSAANAGSYRVGTDGATWDGTQAVPLTAKDCITNSCSSTDLAQSDLQQWRAAVAATLPGSSVNVFLSTTDPRQIGIAVGWIANEGKAGQAGETDSGKYIAPFSVTTATAGVACPADLICHFVYVLP